MEKPHKCIAGGGLLAAIAAVLQLVGSAIRLGPFSVSLVLIPLCWAPPVRLGLEHCSLVRPSCGYPPADSGSGDLRPDGGESPQRRPI